MSGRESSFSTLVIVAGLIVLWAEDAKNVSWPWLSPLRQWDSLTIAYRIFSVCYIKIFPAVTATLWQLCDNAVIDVLIDVVTMVWQGRKWELWRRQFPTLWQRRLGQDVATTLVQRRYDINQWLCRCFLITDNWQFFPYIERKRVTKLYWSKITLCLLMEPSVCS